MIPTAETALINGIFAALTAWLQNKDRTDIPQEMQQAIDQAHAELARLKTIDPSIGDDQA